MKSRLVLTALLTGTLLLTGCTPSDEPTVTAAPTPTATSTPTPAPSPTPTDGIQVHSDPSTGIVFEDVPDLTGDEAEVYNWVAIHQNAFWDTLRTNTVNPAFATISSSEIQDTMARIASNNAAEDARIAGEFHTTISDIVVDGETATAHVCDDFRQATFANNTGELTVAEAGQDVPQRGRVELLRLSEGKWYINRVVSAGTC